MYNCKKCFKNDWAYKFSSHETIAICQTCGNRVGIPKETKEPKSHYKNEPCRHCGVPIEEIIPKIKERQLRQSYYYSKFYKCPNCKATYLDNAFKVLNQNKNGSPVVKALFN